MTTLCPRRGIITYTGEQYGIEHLSKRPRINGVVHLKTVLPPDAVVPIGWVAVGDPAQVLPPAEHDRIWAIQEPLNFPRTVFGLERPAAGESIMPEMTRRYAQALWRHADDIVITGE